uniref:Uncharacterized protein n=1 Tax=viral metagenome TaxID=1070528 RepID=A0A6H1ZJR4_9ZZZZ
MSEPIIFGNVLGGINLTFPPNALPALFLADSKNIVPILNGYATKRGGSSKLNSTAYGTLVTSFHEMIVSGTSSKFAASGTTVGKYNSTTGAFDSHITGLTSGAYGQWLNYGSYAIYANGVDKVKKTDGTTSSDLTTDLSGIPAGNCVAEWGERVWTSIGATLYGSALRAPTDYSTTTTDSGYWEGTIGSTNQGITGLFQFFDILLIGKLNQLYQLSGAPETASSTFRLTPVQTKDKDAMGFTSKDAITQVGNDLIFLDGFAIKSLSGIQAYGDVESVSIVGNIKDFLRASDGAGLDKDHLSKAHFFHHKHKEQIHCSIPTGAATRYWFVIDYSNQELRGQLGLPKYSFFPMSGVTPICFGGIENGSQVDIYSGCEDGYVRQLDTGYNDDSSAIDAHATWCFGNNMKDVQPLSVNLNLRKRTSDCTIQPYFAISLQEWQEILDSTNYTAMDSETVGGSAWLTDHGISQKMLMSFIMNTGRSFTFKLRHNTTSENFEMRDSAFRYRLKRRYVG